MFDTRRDVQRSNGGVAQTAIIAHSLISADFTNWSIGLFFFLANICSMLTFFEVFK